MKKYIPHALAAVSCALTLMCVLKIGQLNDRFSAMEAGLSSQINVISRSVDGAYNQLQAALDEQASLLSSSTWSYGAPDYEKGEVALTFSVTPKEYRPEKTVATPTAPHVDAYTSFDVQCPFEKTFEVSRSSAFTLVLELTDGEGIQYRTLLDKGDLDEEGGLTNHKWGKGEMGIYDAKGNAIFVANDVVF